MSVRRLNAGLVMPAALVLFACMGGKPAKVDTGAIIDAALDSGVDLPPAEDLAPDAGVDVPSLDAGEDATPVDVGVDATTPVCDEDGDGVLSVACGGDDCDDDDSAVHPGASDDIAGCHETSAWTSQAVPTGIFVATASEPSLAIDRAGGRHVTHGSGVTLVYATDASGSWQTESFTGGIFGTVALDAEDRPHVLQVRSDPQGLRVWSLVAGSWTSVDLPGDESQYPMKAQLASGSDGHLHVIAVVGDSLAYHSNASGSWSYLELPTTGAISDPRLAVGPDGRPHVVWQEPPTGLRHAVLIDGQWAVEEPPAGTIQGLDTTVDADGHLWTVYRLPAQLNADQAIDELRVATDASGAWSEELIVVEPFTPSGSYSSSSSSSGHHKAVVRSTTASSSPALNTTKE